MSEVQRIAKQLQLAFEGEAWHGPSVTEALKDVTAAQAAKHPIAGAHSIWEIVLHITTWMNVIHKGIGGEYVKVSDELDFPTAIDPGVSAWEKAIESLNDAQQVLLQTVQKLNDTDLERIPTGSESDIYTLLHGVIQHNLYHAGQIVLLKKLV